MELLSIKQATSPFLPNAVRLSVDFRFASGTPETIWFDVPETFESYLSQRGEAWAVLLSVPAILAGEDLVLDLPTDPHLLDNLKAVQKIWRGWYGLQPIGIRAIEDSQCSVGSKRAVFFSGGIDSYFSLLGPASRQRAGGANSADAMLLVWGFDISLRKPDEFALARELGERAARQFGKQLIPIATNLKDVRGFDRSSSWWTVLSHGVGLAGVAHLLSKGLCSATIASTHDYAHLTPWGSHPLVDPLFSSEKFQIIHDGAAFTRLEKTERICAVPEAASSIRVCYRSGGASNCSRCSKCLRTMVTFDLLDKKNIAMSFDWSGYDLEKVASAFLKNKNDVDFFLEIREAAVQRARGDIVRAIDRSLRNSFWKRGLYTFGERLQRTPFLWRYAEPVRRAFDL